MNTVNTFCEYILAKYTIENSIILRSMIISLTDLKQFQSISIWINNIVRHHELVAPLGCGQLVYRQVGSQNIKQ